MRERIRWETLKLLQRERSKRRFSGATVSYEKECEIERIVRLKVKAAECANKSLSPHKSRRSDDEEKYKQRKSLGRGLSFENWLSKKRLEEAYRKMVVETERETQEEQEDQEEREERCFL
eukprot:TRINITY_DN14354_c0_g8_i1.p3 TRINITY_DN14354_c0_g8~~TRINITY_DN14354_c0_g8_i1.p3  ORF type:complete len:120 (+),score=30.55 TRINITY_DN14354_c0_g8_i1:251-610(+)